MHSISPPLLVASDRRCRLAGLALLSIWLLQLVGCIAEKTPDLVRFIDENPQQELDPDLIYDLEPIYDWSLPGATASLGPDRNLPLLDREIEMAAAEAQVVEVLVESMPQGTLALRWRNDEHPFSKERQIQLQAEHQNPGPVKRFRFNVTAHPLWAGSIKELRIYTDRRIRDSVAPIRCRVLHRTVDGVQLQQAVGRGWKVNLNRDIRNALLATPNSEIVRRLTIPAAATFRFGYGLDPGIRTAVEFQVLVHELDGGEAILFSDTLDGAFDVASGWHEAAIDLGSFEGQTVDLKLRAVANLEPENGFPLWTNPEVVGGRFRARHPNVVVVSIDTLRPDHLSLYGYDRQTSPNLDRWASGNSVVFEKAVAQAPSTLPSHTSMFTGLDAFRHGANHDPAPTSLETLAEALRRSGYRTLADTGGGYMHPAYGFAQGFDVYRYWLWGYQRLDEFGSGLATVRGWLDSHRDRPFFLFFHTYEVHAPYRARQPFFERLSGRAEAPDELLWMTARPATADEGFRPTRGLDYRYGSPDPAASSSRRGSAAEAIDLYDSSIAYVDSGLGQIFDLLEESELAANTLVVITSDHGESFGEHDLAGHGYLYDDNLLVPLIVAFPGREFAGRRVATQVRSIDILPTLLDALGLPPIEGIDGHSLVPLLQGTGDPQPRMAWSYAANDNFGTALRVDDHVKYIFNDSVWPPIHGDEELYNLESDPEELVNLAESSTKTEPLRDRLRSTLAARSRSLVIELRNEGSETIRGQLSGDWVGPTRVKSPNLSCACISWQDDVGVVFEVPPKVGYDLLIDANPATFGSIQLAPYEGFKPTTQPFEQSFRLEELVEPVTIALSNKEWQTSLGSLPQEATGLHLRWQGRSAEDGVDLVNAEADLRRQMKALGYLQ